MGLKQFFMALLGMDDPDEIRVARERARHKQHLTKGKGVASADRVAVITVSDKLRLHLSEQLKPVVEARGFVYNDSPDTDQALGSRIIIIDARPEIDAKIHNEYDQVLRMKKAMGKLDDITCIIALRDDYRKFPRGTYPHSLLFSIEGDNFAHREPDLDLSGSDTIQGPTLYNVADLPAVIDAMIRDISPNIRL